MSLRTPAITADDSSRRGLCLAPTTMPAKLRSSSVPGASRSALDRSADFIGVGPKKRPTICPMNPRTLSTKGTVGSLSEPVKVAVNWPLLICPPAMLKLLVGCGSRVFEPG